MAPTVDDTTRHPRRRDAGIARLRRLTNWSLSAMLVAVGATTVALARSLPGHSSSATTSTATSGTTTSGGTTGSSSSSSSGTVHATTGASGAIAGTPTTGSSTGNSSTAAPSVPSPVASSGPS